MQDKAVIARNESDEVTLEADSPVFLANNLMYFCRGAIYRAQAEAFDKSNPYSLSRIASLRSQ